MEEFVFSVKRSSAYMFDLRSVTAMLQFQCLFLTIAVLTTPFVAANPISERATGNAAVACAEISSRISNASEVLYNPCESLSAP